jgi:hypothetical protein
MNSGGVKSKEFWWSKSKGVSHLPSPVVTGSWYLSPTIHITEYMKHVAAL